MKTCVDNYGSRYAEEAEIQSIATEVVCSADNIDAGGVPVCSDGKTSYVLNHDCHSIVFGATGSMKTRRVIMATIATLIKHGESIIVNDPKGELYRKFAKLLDHQGYQTHVLNFREPQAGSSRWNPLSIVYSLYAEGKFDKSDMYLRDISKCIFSQLASNCNDVFWTNTAEDYFVGLAQLLRKEAGKKAFTIENIRLTHTLGNQRCGISRYLNEYCNGIEQNSEIVANLSGTIQAPNDTRESVCSTFAQGLSLYAQNALCDMLCESDFELSMIGKRKTAIFIITPDERTVYNPIIATFIKLCYGIMIDVAESKECGGTLPVRVNFVIDEFSNLPSISDFNAMISAARSRHIRFNLVVQSLAALYKTYSETIAENIITNCEIWYVLRSNDDKLHDRIRKMCGTHVSEHLHIERPLINTLTIQRLDKVRGEVLIKILGHYPFITELPDIDEYDFNLPASAKTEHTLREPKKRVLFDIRKLVLKRREEETKGMMNTAPPSQLLIPDSSRRVPDFDMGDLVKQINERIEAFEAKEKKEEVQG